MRQITDFKEVSPLVLKYFRRGVLTNNFLSAEDYKCEITEGRLFYCCGEDFLNIYVKRDGFFQLYFHALSSNALFPEIQTPLVCDVAGEFGELLKSNGFLERMVRVKLEIEEGRGVGSALVTKAEVCDAEKIFELFEKGFDKITGYSPNRTQIEKECEKGLILKAAEKGRLLGALRTGTSGKTAFIKHLCVAEEYRGRSVGKALCLSFLAENQRAAVWTGKENIPALGLYKTLGFRESQTEATVYVKG